MHTARRLEKGALLCPAVRVQARLTRTALKNGAVIKTEPSQSPDKGYIHRISSGHDDVFTLFSQPGQSLGGRLIIGNNRINFV